MRQRTRIAAALALPAVAVGLAACGGSSGPSESAASQTASAAPLAAAAANAAATDQLIPDLVQRVDPAIVSVLTSTGQGSGVVWDGAHGIVVTNNHVVEGANRVEVVTSDGEHIPARVRATDPASDLAVLEVDRTDLVSARFADTQPRVGELAVAVGNPLGFENSVTAGIVSALHRSLGGGPYVDLIQTDAPISPGNSGGALVNAAGEVIGINSAGIPPTERANSLGFAIPSTTVIPVVRQLLATGHASQAFLGITASQAQDEIGANAGAKVESVSAGSAAAAAGLRPGDVIVRVADQPVTTPDDLLSALRSHAPGDQVSLTVERDGARTTLTATLAANQAA
jgi:S1-C subfamily serine protease